MWILMEELKAPKWLMLIAVDMETCHENGYIFLQAKALIIFKCVISLFLFRHIF